ncbi:phytochelatin synthase family protein [Thalassotalea aquiviva]|uniref:phytochelatin synthase family protein n=1 Tax=Thalassotalea aquiviva TaxID=3242415 RepID=UPI00352B2208
MIILLIGLVGFIGWNLYPHQNLQNLPDELISLNSELGLKLLEQADFKQDYALIDNHFIAQSTVSYCGVASGAMVLNALGEKTDQINFFNANTNNIKSRWQVTFTGMSLSDLTGFLLAYGKPVKTYYASDSSLDLFRQVLRDNLQNEHDFILVNYQREALGQGRVGHISPIVAFHQQNDLVLIMDTAAHKYPPTWVPVSLLFNAMLEQDNSVGKSRGYIEVSAN